jgi:hypothetical protein
MTGTSDIIEVQDDLEVMREDEIGGVDNRDSNYLF